MVNGLCVTEMCHVYHMGVNLTHYLLLDDALCLWGVRRSRNEEFIFLFTDPLDMKLFRFQISYLIVECQE